MIAAPPKVKVNVTPTLSRWTLIILCTLAVLGGAVLYFYNPTKYGFYPICQFHRLTGWNCPGCGGTRALYALLHGQFQVAFRDNALFLGCLVAGSIRGTWLGILKWRGQPTRPFILPWMAWTLLVITVSFGVIRNLPGFEWLSPS